MRPRKPQKQPQEKPFQVRLDVVCDPSNPLVKLADRIDWEDLDEQFASLYASDGRPATVRSSRDYYNLHASEWAAALRAQTSEPRKHPFLKGIPLSFQVTEG